MAKKASDDARRTTKRRKTRSGHEDGKWLTVAFLAVIIVIVLRLFVHIIGTFPVSQDESGTYSAIADILSFVIALVAAIVALDEYRGHQREVEEDHCRQIIEDANGVEAWIGVRPEGGEGNALPRAVILSNTTDAPLYNFSFEVYWHKTLSFGDHPAPNDTRIRHSGYYYGPGFVSPDSVRTPQSVAWKMLPPGTWAIKPRSTDSGLYSPENHDERMDAVPEKWWRQRKDGTAYVAWHNWDFPTFLGEDYGGYSPASKDPYHAILVLHFSDSYGYTWEKRYTPRTTVWRDPQAKDRDPMEIRPFRGGGDPDATDVKADEYGEDLGEELYLIDNDNPRRVENFDDFVAFCTKHPSVVGVSAESLPKFLATGEPTRSPEAKASGTEAPEPGGEAKQ